MIQNQLVEYIAAQKKAGISRDAIASALVGVGWQASDVEETLKKVESDAGGQAAVRPVQVSPASSAIGSAKPVTESKPFVSSISSAFPKSPASGVSPSPFASGPAKPSGFGASSADAIGGVVAPKTASSPQPIRVSDFIGPTSSSSSSSSAPSGMAKLNAIASSSRPMNPMKTSGGVVAVAPGKNMAMIVEIAVIVVLAGLSIFLYVQNMGLSSKVSDLTTSTGSASTQTSDLQSQVQTLTASQSSLQGQVSGLASANGDLKAQLSFFAAPIGTATVASGTVAGTLVAAEAPRNLYSVRTLYDAVVFVKNSSDPKVAAMLKPMVGSSVTIAGSYVPGSDAITVVSVNGNLVNPPAVAATTTATAASTTTSTMP